MRAWFLNCILSAVLLVCSQSKAEVRLPALISDGMVLQQGENVRIWGWADPGERVEVTIAGQREVVQAGADGRWLAIVKPLKPQGPFELIVTGKNVLRVRDVLVGEVWLASGQSNMAFRLQGAQDATNETALARYPTIRVFMIEERFSQAPCDDVKGAWQECTPEHAAQFSAVAYCFGRDLHKALKVPVGLVVSAVGGTRIESWMARELLEADPVNRAALEQWDTCSPEEFEQIAKTYRAYQQERSRVAALAKLARERGETPPPAPKMPARRCHDCPSALYNGMIAPLVPATIRGVIWYQGESNASNPERYATLFPEMIHQWRRDFRQERLPFLFVQLANYQAPGAPDSYARLRESQRLALRVPATGMAVAIDIGEAADIHPRNKQEVGRRLSLWALNRVYERDGQYTGPLYRSISVRRGKATVRFKHAEGGLVARGGALQGFEIAGKDGRFHPANAQITGDAVQVWSDAETRPVAVRYAWADNPEGCNLYNQAGLPASPFTTAHYPVKIGKEK